MPRPSLPTVGGAVRLAAALALPLAAAPSLRAAASPRPATGYPAGFATATPESSIVATVNGSVISRADVTNRGRLFAISGGLPVTPEVLDRLRAQITRQLIDERLRLQESQRRHIIITDKQIADAIGEIEHRNNLPPGALRAKLAGDGVSLRTLIDQIRVQLAWTQVLRQQLADNATITPAEIAEQEAALKNQTGRQEYRIGEIFIPIENPEQTADAQRFAETVIAQLRAGAPFGVTAAQFSQSQNALSGGDLGWTEANQLDTGVARVAAEMPVGAISNPIQVPGGLSIIQMRAKREIGNDIGTVVSLRQTFLPFVTPLNPQAPTEQQRQALEKAKSISAGVHSCAQMEEANKAAGAARPADPGEVRLEGVNPPQFRQILATLPPDRASQPLVSPDGIAIVIVCGREQKNLASLTKEEISNKILSERIELASRQLQRDLRRKGMIDERETKTAGG